MKNKVIMLVPSTDNVSLVSAVLGFYQLLQKRNIPVHFFKPVQYNDKTDNATHTVMSNMCAYPITPPISAHTAQQHIAQNNLKQLLEQVVGNFFKNSPDTAPIILIEGVAYTHSQGYTHHLNYQIARALSADIVLVSTPYDNDPAVFDTHLAISANLYGTDKVCGVIVTAPIGENHSMDKHTLQACKIFDSLPLIGTMDYKADVINDIAPDWIQNYIGMDKVHILTPPVFLYQLVARSQTAPKRIILPEGDEPRTICASTIVAAKDIAECYLLGDPNKIRHVATEHGINIDVDGLHILNADPLREKYIPRLVALRKHKGEDENSATEQLQDNVVLGTMMLESDEMDGLVSGAVHTTANTIRPPLQIIKTAPNVSLVSSIFFMCLPEQVLVYGDCAINPNPTADQLADIAIQSADSATKFGLNPKVAMISYSTGTSGAGADVDKVATATQIVRQKRPDIVVDGPLQYDTAIMANVAKSKAPNSPVAGQATVFIFPDLNTGNTTYKAVQRSTDCVSIGPMLQGLNKPVNDLSRGALVQDIVYTIALTTVQAQL